MAAEASKALRDLRDALRTPSASIEEFVSQLSTALSALSFHPTSVPPSQITEGTLKAIQKYLPAIQVSLLTIHLPTFLHALENGQSDLVDRFFVPPKTSDLSILPLSREIMNATYATLPSFLSARASGPGQATLHLPAPCRPYLLKTLDRLSQLYGIDDLYWSVWPSSDQAESSRDGALRMMKWEECVKAVTSLSAKAANAAGRWASEGGQLEIPDRLNPRTYFPRLISRLEALMYETQDRPESVERVQLVLQRLASIGLLSPGSTTHLVPHILPLLLHRLHPPSPLPSYHSTYLPRVFLGLPTSNVDSFIAALIPDLVRYIPSLPPEKPDEDIKRAAQVLSSIIGEPKVGNEAWDAVLRLTTASTSMRNDNQTRLIVAWISQSPAAIEPFIDTVLSTWVSAKHIKYALYSPQFQLTYTLLLALSLLSPFHPFLSGLAFRPAFLMACQSYLSHPDPSIRRLGMLVAEILSELTIKEEDEGDGLEYDEKRETEELLQGLEIDDGTGAPKKREPRAPKGMKRLRFGGGMWDGQGEGREEVRWLRSAVGVRDSDAVLQEGGDWMLGWRMPSIGAESFKDPIDQGKAINEFASRGRLTRKAIPDKTPIARVQPPKQPKIVMLDEAKQSDPLQSYSPPGSPTARSRSPSPDSAYLDEIAADPSLALDASQKKKITRPVYILQLLQLLRTKDSPDAIEMAIKHGEELIRAKRTFGLELAENAVPLVGQLVGMNDQYGLEEWEERRQGMVTALVACGPRQVAPYLAEQYFTNQYSLQQKSIMLTAISMGARELAGLAVPDIKTRRIDFPSKTLPAALHRRYISAADTPRDERGANYQIEAAAEGVRGMLLDKGAKKAADVLPDVAREKRLRVSSTLARQRGSQGLNGGSGIAEVGTLRDRQLLERRSDAERQMQAPVVAFSEIAAEFFIMPLINRFWTHFQDVSTRDARAVASGNRYRGAGTGLITSPMALEKLLMTLSLLVHAARNSTAFLTVLAPEAVELGLTIGVRHKHRPEEGEETDDDGSKSESQVVGGALELILVAMDLSMELDGGRTILMDKMELIMAAGEWARGIFDVESRGGKVIGGQGGQGGREGRIRNSAAGVVVRVGEMMQRWGGAGAGLRR